MIGRSVCKNFHRYGMFHGTVTEVAKPYFKITYVDGDEEDIDIEELWSILVPLTDKVDLDSPYINFGAWLDRRKKSWYLMRQESKKRSLEPPICEGLKCACKRSKYSTQMNWPVERVDVLGKVLSKYCSASIAERVHSLNPTSVFNACHGHIAQTGGHRFQFQEVRLRAYERLRSLAELEGKPNVMVDDYEDNSSTYQSSNSVNRLPSSLLVNKKSNHPGVYWHASTRKWVSTFTCQQRLYHIGSYDCEESAIAAYNSSKEYLLNDLGGYFSDENNRSPPEGVEEEYTDEASNEANLFLLNHRLLIHCDYQPALQRSRRALATN
jgi:hypothetical protein